MVLPGTKRHQKVREQHAINKKGMTVGWNTRLHPFRPLTRIKFKPCQKMIHSANIVKERSYAMSSRRWADITAAPSMQETWYYRFNIATYCISNSYVYMQTSCWCSTLIQVPGLDLVWTSSIYHLELLLLVLLMKYMSITSHKYSAISKVLHLRKQTR
jgi:hypothetical protein